MDNRNVQYISQRLSLRKPQEESLAILSELADKLTLSKDQDLNQALEVVRSLYPTCQSFEREFPSLCFSLATGVGKTRLMGAFIAYLHIEKGINNFFVLAPNLTIYNKLMDDLENTTSTKYVFRGIDRFAQLPPQIVKGEDYKRIVLSNKSNDKIYGERVKINIFNISKFINEKNKMRSFSEYIGDSYFNYLRDLPDLVLLMDESHRYRGQKGLEVLNELNPILGLELTATPQIEQGNKSEKFLNVVYEYSLAKAMRDGFVKEPAVATKKDFDPTKYSAEELDHIKLVDGLKIHQETKSDLIIYAHDNNLKLVKPFVLVVAKDTDHAASLKEYIESADFFNGKYINKVIVVHSKQGSEEKDENIEQLLKLEHPENTIEIVIHVNMLKEGWDVTNLYTIIPLRASASQTLTEQTIGRGLRLPFGKRTGDIVIDRLTIVAHDKFQAIIDEANKEGSIIKRENIIVLDDEELDNKNKTVEIGISKLEERLQEEKTKVEQLPDSEEKDKKNAEILIKQKIYQSINVTSPRTTSTEPQELQKEQIKQKITQRVKTIVKGHEGQLNAFLQKATEQELEEIISTSFEDVYREHSENAIHIPRISIQPRGETVSEFEDFDLNTSKLLRHEVPSNEILIKLLRAQANDTSTIRSEVQYSSDSPENILVSTLIDEPEIDYDIYADLLMKLAGQAVGLYRSYVASDSDLSNLIQGYRKNIASEIFRQMREHYEERAPEFEKNYSSISQIKEYYCRRQEGDRFYEFTETIEPTSDIPKKVFRGFRKAFHNQYQFHSKSEKDFSIILEHSGDDEVVKWLRPAPTQFDLRYHHNEKNYEPDFVVETPDCKYLVEVKKAADVENKDVQAKAKVAIEYCEDATQRDIDKKPWKYLLIPHDAVTLSSSFNALAFKYVQGKIKTNV